LFVYVILRIDLDLPAVLYRKMHEHIAIRACTVVDSMTERA
jgi:hypothetical protein